MKNYVVGDIQGCYKGLRKLLKKAGFDPHVDKLWAVGDLVARGPDSLATLEYLMDLGPSFDTVLGNHDLHLIAGAYGVSKIKSQDRLDTVVNHKKFSSFIDFLKTKPLAIQVNKNILISHAGLYPSWSFKRAVKMSARVQQALQAKKPEIFLQSMYGNMPSTWSKKLDDEEKLRFSVNALTRMRFVDQSLALDFQAKSHPSNAPKHLLPWFQCSNPKTKPTQTILFGHWASLLGQIPKQIASPAKVVALDTGYVWGNTMSMYCIETHEIVRYQA